MLDEPLAAEPGTELAPIPVDEPQGMSEEDMKDAAQALIKAARDYMVDDIHPALEKAWHYYNGNVWASPMWPKFDDYGNIAIDETTGRPIYEGSSVVVTTCWDTVQAVLPEMYRVFTSSSEIVEFQPEGGEDVAGAAQATAYATDIWRRNAGEDLLNPAMIDYLVKFVAFRVTWQDETAEEEETFSGLDETAVMMLANDDSVISIEAEPNIQVIRSQQADPMTGAMMPVDVELVTYSGRFVREVPKGRIAVETIPQEELIVDGDAATCEAARCIGQWGERLVTDVVATGIDAALVMEHAKEGAVSEEDQVRRARTGEEREAGTDDEGRDPSLSYVTYIEALIRLDADGDGIAERYHVVALGEEAEVVEMDRRDDVHYIIDSPYETPHKIIGSGVVEKTIDLQDMATSLFRAVLNNLNRSINPREVVIGDDDEALRDMQSIFGGPIKTQAGTALSWHQVPFVAPQAFPIVEYVESRAASRTGISAAGAGLDPDILKGQTVEAAHAVVSAPQSRIEYLIRRFAIGVMRNMFRAILKLSVAHQNQPQMIRLRRQFVPVDPRSWNAEMDCTPKVGLGTGTRAEKLTALNLVAQKQEQLLLAGSPLVTMTEYRKTLGEMAEVAGLKDDDAYFKELTPQEAQAWDDKRSAQALQAQESEAKMKIAEEQAKAQAKMQADAQKAQIDGQQKLAEMELQARLNREAQLQEHQLAMQRMQAELEVELQLMQAGHPAGQGNMRRRSFSA